MSWDELGLIEIRYDVDGTLCQPDEYDRYEGMSEDEGIKLCEAIQAQQKLALKWANIEEEEELGPQATIAICHFCRSVLAWDALVCAQSTSVFADDEEASERLEDAIALAYMRPAAEA